MSKNKKIIIFVICVLVVFFLTFTLFFNNKSNKFNVAKDEIALQIKLDTKEDIGLIVYDYSVSGKEHSAGISNADKSLIKNNDVIIQTMSKKHEFDNLSNIEDLTLKFTIITKYIDPNYDNIYPEKYTKIIETPISIKAHFGELYYITITGDKVNGYKATLEK